MGTKKLAAILAFVSLGVPALAQAPALYPYQDRSQPHFFTGEKLLSLCTGDIATAKGLVGGDVCMGYITGVVDASTGMETHAATPTGTILLPLCLPPEISRIEIVQGIVVKFMEEHRQALDEPAVYLVHNALASFACKSGWPDGISPPSKKVQ
jgi:Ssp1 endopeptidase immunity protein Rap1a